MLPRQPAEDEKAMWRSAAHHASTVTMCPGSWAGTRHCLFFACSLRTTDVQQGAYSQGGGGASGSAVDEQLGLRVGAEGVLSRGACAIPRHERWYRLPIGIGRSNLQSVVGRMRLGGPTNRQKVKELGDKIDVESKAANQAASNLTAAASGRLRLG
jgi:hypothetical protein